MKTTTAFLILLLFVAGGCVTRTETVKTPYPPEERPTVQDKRVVIDPALKGVIRLVGVTAKPSDSGFLKIQVNVQSLSDSSRVISYRISWFDKNGNELPLADSPLTTWMFLPHETSFLAVSSPTPAARDFRVELVGPGS